jgi:ABC-type transport system substrate-binding protein
LRARIIAILALSVLLPLTLYQYPVATLMNITSDLNMGPYVDRVIYRVNINQDQRFLALQAGEIDMDMSFFDPVHYNALNADPDIGIYTATQNGYGCIIINCRDAPLNETALRRAFAFAFDKTRVTSHVYNGWSREHDSVVPYPNGWCIEDELPWHYYTAQPEVGSALFNMSGLFPYGPDGWRTYKGQPMDPIEFEMDLATSCICNMIAQIVVDALLSLDIPAVVKSSRYNDYISRLNQHGVYDMVFLAYKFYGDDITGLGDLYYSANAYRENLNPSNFMNATFDSCLPQFWNGTTYNDVYNASRWMQRILHEQVPLLVVYESTYNQAYRIDKFTGHVPDFGRYISGPWTLRHVHLIEGSTPTQFATGGTFKMAIDKDPDSFNIYITNSAYAYAILDEMWLSLYVYDPEGRPWPYLAKKLITETHIDNPEVPVSHTRFTIDIIQNASWSDGIPLTAYDVAFTFAYSFESMLLGSTSTPDLSALIAVYAPNYYQVVFEFNSETYWNFNQFAFQYIIPEHVFNNVTGIVYVGWKEWNPVFDPDDPQVTAGPFTLNDFKRGEYYNLSFNPSFAYSVPHASEIVPTPADNSTYPNPYDFSMVVFVSGVSTCIIIVVASELIRSKLNKNR